MEETNSSTAHTTPPLKKKRKPSALGEIISLSLIALVVVFPIRFFIAQPFIVSGSSMDPTFHDGQYLIVDQLSYQFNTPQRGEVIVFKYPKDPSKYFIKRVIGVPGDTLTIDGDIVTIKNADHEQGFVLSEPYVKHMQPTANMTETLGEHEYFVMGDNRDASSDSRVWGVLQDDHIIGRTFVRLFPVADASFMPGSLDKFTGSNVQKTE